MEKDFLLPLKIDKLIEHMPGGFFIYEDTPEGKILYANQELYSIFGCANEAEFAELTNNSFTEMVYSEDRKRVLKEIYEQIAVDHRGFDKVVYRIKDKAGNLRWLSDYGHLVETPEMGRAFYVFVSDITQEKYNNDHLRLLLELERLREIFVMVRLVNVNNNLVYDFDATGQLVETDTCCFSVWGKCRRCENCVSTKAYGKRGQQSKIEFKDGVAYYVVTRYVELMDTGYVMEMITRLDDSALFNVYDQNIFAKQLQEFNRKAYKDALTDAYNRHYLEEQLINLDNLSAVAMIDLDHFKEVNDRYGHTVGDIVLRDVSKCISECVRVTDALVRYGGDEFLLIFTDFKKPILWDKMEFIRKRIESLVWNDYPEIRITISIGGVYTNNLSADVIAKVDRLMYEAKRTKNTVLIK